MFTLSEHVKIISSFFIFVEPFRLKQMQKKGLMEKKIRSNVNWNQRYMWGSILFYKYNINR